MLCLVWSIIDSLLLLIKHSLLRFQFYLVDPISLSLRTLWFKQSFTSCRSIPLEERSRAVAFVFGGLSVGSVAGYVEYNFT